MKKVKHLASALLLILVLAVAGFGGIIECPGPQPPPGAAASKMTLGEIGIPGDGHTPGSPSESAGVVALNLLTELLLVF